MPVSTDLDIRRQHEVNIYRDLPSHVRVVADFLAPALAGHGGAAVVVATEPVRTRLRDELRTAGIEFDISRLCEFDASETLAGFYSDGHIDETRFGSIVGEVLHRAARSAGHGPLCVYGEMVAVLWEAGDVAAAIDLERAWNDLGPSPSFRLLCGYPSYLMGPELEEDFLEVCGLHTAARDARPFDVAQTLAPTRDAARSARQFVEHRLAPFVDGDQLHDMALIISELATNALSHAQSPFTVSLSGSPSEMVRVSVTDQDCNLPRMRHTNQLSTHGRGLSIVSTLATRWGIEPSCEGKTVWAEVAFR